jgi:lipopolysaccharide/colanic/teichoic acid biosynthesis glycosyltransferase
MSRELKATEKQWGWRQDSRHLPVAEPPLRAHRRWYLPCKYAADRLVALCLVALAAPFILVSALLVKLTSRGPIFYSQTRLGRLGRLFKIYKLRTMAHDCEKISGPQWSSAGDTRITPIGRFLRRTHLDELPQLWNVLRGDMSLVGPRPERPEFLPKLEQALPHYRDRLLVRPGMTGLAQVQLPADTNLKSVRRKLAYDLYYVRHVGPWLDFRLLLCTGFYLVGVSFYLMQKLLLVPRRWVIERHYRSVTPKELRPAPQAATA